jgi:hypothetical protein
MIKTLKSISLPPSNVFQSSETVQALPHQTSQAKIVITLIRNESQKENIVETNILKIDFSKKKKII